MPGVTNSRGTEVERFWRKVKIVDSGCWEWQAGLQSEGYGMFGLETKRPYEHLTVLAHVWAFERYVKKTPAGLELDHLCRNPRCVNPLHLEPVTHRLNLLRGNHPTAVTVRTNRCCRGHLLTEDNVLRKPNARGRYCRACKRIRDALYYQRKKQRRKNYGKQQRSTAGSS